MLPTSPQTKPNNHTKRCGNRSTLRQGHPSQKAPDQGSLINYNAPNNQSNQLKILKEMQAKLKNIQIIDGTSCILGGGLELYS